MNETNPDRQPEMTQEEQWRSLAVQAQAGNQAAYNALLRGIGMYAKAVLSGRLANPDWMDDVVQDVLISVHKSLETYSPDRPFRPWLTSIIYFRRTDFLRRYYRRKRDKMTSLDNPEFINSHVTMPAHAGEYRDVERALEQLTEKQREIFKRLKIKGYTAKEVARDLGMGVSAVKVSAHRTLKKLKGMLE